MMELELSIRIKLSCQRALWGAITPNIRLICIDWNELKEFKLRAYYDSYPTEEDIEEMECVTTEVISDIDFLNLKPVECLFSSELRKNLDTLKFIIYSRKE